jgi:hypothetical protein
MTDNRPKYADRPTLKSRDIRQDETVFEPDANPPRDVFAKRLQIGVVSLPKPNVVTSRTK